MKLPATMASLLSLALLCSSALAVEVNIDTKAARAVVDALGDPALTHARAEEIAHMPQNRAPLDKLAEFGIHASEADFANALFKAAHGEPPASGAERNLLFDRAMPRLADIDAMLKRIEHEPAQFQDAIGQRIALYAPAGLELTVSGTVLVAGDGAGYTFEAPDFYLNLIMIDDLAAARIVTTHEMYHAVQGAFRQDRVRLTSALPAACVPVQKMFDALYREGSAVEVEDVSLLAQLTGPNGKHMQDDMLEGTAHLPWSFTLLDMSMAAFLSATPLPFDDVYATGFLGHGALYNVGYAMAKAIADAQGPAALAAFLRRPAQDFVRAYMALPAYGRDAAHPKVGVNTIAALARCG